jgi:hypothetical protein
MTVPREGLDGVVATVPSGDDTVPDKTFIFVVGGRPDATGSGYFTSGERAQVLDDGDLGDFVPLSHDLNQARAFYELLENQGQNDDGFDDDDDDDDDDTDTNDDDDDDDDDIIITKGSELYNYQSFVTRYQDPEIPLYLLAIMGDDEYENGKNTGTTTFEVCEIATPDGDNDAWFTQEANFTGQGTHGHGGLLYFDHMFVFTGVARESLGANPSAMSSSCTRYDFIEVDPPNMTQVVTGHQSVGGSFYYNRAYYDMVRMNGYDFVVGGNDEGFGPMSTMERTFQ